MEIKKTLAIGAFTAAIASSALFISPEEGISMTAYQDSVNVWTVCRGHTGKDVIRGKVYTTAMCDSLFRSDIWAAMSGVLSATKDVPPTPVLVAFTSFAFNVGVSKFKTSTMLKKYNTGDLAGACKEPLRWKFAGGLDCSVRSNGCYGVWSRRNREVAMCESGIK